MTRKERGIHKPQGLFDNPRVMEAYQGLREGVVKEPVASLIPIIEDGGPTLVVDPEEVYKDPHNTLERVRIAAGNGMKVMEIGGSTDENNAAEVVIPLIREAVDEVGGETFLMSFPGTSSQVQPEVDGVYSLILPQLEEVSQKNPLKFSYLIDEYFEIIARSRRFGLPIIPITYILFNGGEPTSVEKVTEIEAINVRDGVDVAGVMKTIAPWLKPKDVVMLEMGSGPDKSVNLGPVAKEVYGITGVRPIVTGGIDNEELIKDITKHGHFPTVVGSKAEQTPPHLFEKLYLGLREAHPSTREA